MRCIIEYRTYNEESCSKTSNLSVTRGEGFHRIKNLILILRLHLALGNVVADISKDCHCIAMREEVISVSCSPFVFLTVDERPVRFASIDEVRPGHCRERLHHKVDTNIPSQAQPKSVSIIYLAMRTQTFSASYSYIMKILAVFLAADLTAVRMMFDGKRRLNSVIETCKTASVPLTVCHKTISLPRRGRLQEL